MRWSWTAATTPTTAATAAPDERAAAAPLDQLLDSGDGRRRGHVGDRMERGALARRDGHERGLHGQALMGAVVGRGGLVG
ncbi:MAG: hypothetical protein ACRDSK_03695 [Actinophytocola sp.]|uniref:hypothetical protein n=1 Tax=Actinophytocola sp. TaxID=1872138 RepID=UPI003D6A6370